MLDGNRYDSVAGSASYQRTSSRTQRYEESRPVPDGSVANLMNGRGGLENSSIGFCQVAEGRASVTGTKHVSSISRHKSPHPRYRMPWREGHDSLLPAIDDAPVETDCGAGYEHSRIVAHVHQNESRAFGVLALGGSVAKFVRIGEFSALDGVRSWRMNDFKGRHFGGEIVRWAVRW